MSKSINQQKKEAVEEFVKLAFCVTGTAKTVFQDVTLKDHPCIQLTDEKRGEFTVIILPNTTKYKEIK